MYRASTIPSNILVRCCQSDTWCAGQKKIRGTFFFKHLPSSNDESKRKTQTNKHFFPQTGGCSEGLGAFRFFFKNDKEKGTRITKYTCQKKIDEEHSIERVWRIVPAASHPIPSPARNHAPKRVASTTFRTLRVSVFTNGTIDVA